MEFLALINMLHGELSYQRSYKKRNYLVRCCLGGGDWQHTKSATRIVMSRAIHGVHLRLARDFLLRY